MTGLAEPAAAPAVGDISAPDAYGPTPCRVFRHAVAAARIASVASVRDALSRPPVELILGYSFKTNPRREMVVAARERGFFAETISREEVEWARTQGFGAEHVIYNGPHPMVDAAAASHIAVAFADSVEALIRNVRRRVGRLRGIRLRPGMVPSRFGVPVEDDETLAAVAAAIEPRAPFAVSFHARQADFNGADWRDVAGDVLERAVRLQAATRRPIVAFDVGGGWRPDEFDARFASDTAWLIDRIRADLPACTRLIAEPGQAICTPAEAILTEVVEVRERRGRREAVLDAGHPDWPEMNEYVHGLYAWRERGWQRLGRGPDRLLGRTCLEYDKVEGVRFPPDLVEGDRLLLTDTGSYDHAMAFDFARGEGSHRVR